MFVQIYSGLQYTHNKLDKLTLNMSVVNIRVKETVTGMKTW